VLILQAVKIWASPLTLTRTQCSATALPVIHQRTKFSTYLYLFRRYGLEEVPK